ncbi:MAG: response regulator transcription factor [Anaerolineae bacterium]|jgi:DNA-binding response OmpR family regulator|nr:response regulator transcription factor [Anaerolineae bacterium]
MIKILIVDDEAPIIDMLSYNLKRANYEVLSAWDGEEALAIARREQPDLIVLDLMLPKLDGLDVCRTLRRERDVPIIMLTARDEEIDRVVGLELGADDYVVKPFSVRELLVRIKNVLRRVQGAQPTGEAPTGAPQLHAGALSLDPARREVRLAGTFLELTTLEFDLLHLLITRPGWVFSREQLLEQVWGYDYVEDARVVDAVIKRLRAKLRAVAPEGDGLPHGDLIETVRGVGYRLETGS